MMETWGGYVAFFVALYALSWLAVGLVTWW